jgi:phage tail protein X
MADETFIRHVTRDADRWDLIASTFYGDATNYAGLIAANPRVPIYPVLPAGVELFIPIIPPPATTQPLPPWIAAAQKAGQL